MRRPAHATVEVLRLDASSSNTLPDDVVVEEPLEIRVSADTLAVTMRTPGHDRELALGWLFSEGIVTSREDVSAIDYCGRVDEPGYGNVLEVTPSPGAKFRFGDEHAPFIRRGTVTAACGVCGRQSIDDLLARITSPGDAGPVPRSALLAAVEALGKEQPLFARTGGSHAAALVRFDGATVCVYEDVGRHNAVDKVIGDRLLAGALPLVGHVLAVSGRMSFEMVQKAASAGVSAVCGVSAASSLAIETATRAGLVLAGFVRGESLVVYAGGARVT